MPPTDGASRLPPALDTVLERVAAVPEWAWVAVAVALRAGFALSLGDRLYQIDEGAYDAAARFLRSTGSLANAEGRLVMFPIPPSFFAAFLALLDHRAAPRLAQGLVSAATAWMLGRAAEDMTGSRRAGRATLALAAVYPFFIYYSAMLMTESLYVFFIVLGFWRLARSLAGAEAPPWEAAAAGAALGAAALCRGAGAYIVFPILVLAGAAACATRRWAWRSWGVAVVCWLLPLTGFAQRNKGVVGARTLDTHGGITLLHGTRFLDLNEEDTSRAQQALEREPFYAEAMAASELERDAIFKRHAFAYMKEDPLRMVRQWARKLVNFWRFWPRTDKAYHETGTSSPGAGLGRKGLVLISLCFEPWLIVCGLLGLYSMLKHRPACTWPLALFVLGTMLIHMLSVSQMRYRLPVMPWLMLGVAWLIASREERA